MNSSFQELMRQATRLTHFGRLKEATEAIQRALYRTSTQGAAHGPFSSDGEAEDKQSGDASGHSSRILDGCDYTVLEENAGVALTGVPAESATDTAANAPSAEKAPATSEPGTFTSGLHTHQGQRRHYKLFAPANAGSGRPLIVMLHGCTQDPDDFAAGTRMNELAREERCYVLYPAQSKVANPSKCWNWFNDSDQHRGAGEPALLAAMTQAVINEHRIDATRVYIAGLSAGGAMAATTAAAYPDIFAAAGVHSGLPRGAAKNMAGALMAMKSGAGGIGPLSRARQDDIAPATPVPTIVFHGDEDKTVNPRNGEQVIAAALKRASGDESEFDAMNGRAPEIEQGLSEHGMRYTRSTHRNQNGEVVAEHWVLHGAGHAWSGGDSKGSYTDARGPDATREMLRFFQGHSK
jgi:poly(hydroxyalkanoate) depolymerase family esterase